MRTLHAVIKTLLAGALVLLASSRASASPTSPWGIRGSSTYQQTIERVVAMPWDHDLVARVTRLGLNVVNITWEDTGRFAGSAVGPNISDLTLQVRENVGSGVRTHLLPVIRHPNFSDKTADLPADSIWIRVGNQSGGSLVAIPMTEALSNLKEYLHDPSSLPGKDNFLLPSDSHFLVSAQHVFVPLPPRGKAEFNPVLFNYQSAPSSPAVLTLLVTREGTSATIIDNRPGEETHQGWGQQLFFNNKGQKTAFTAERKSRVKAHIERGDFSDSDAGALEEGADMMMIVQVPLIQRNRRVFPLGDDFEAAAPSLAKSAPSRAKAPSRGGSDVEQAVLGHGKDLGPYMEMGGVELVRDARFPIRITIQFYRATSNGVVSNDDLKDVLATISRVYEEADYVGSLVVPEGDQSRPTDWLKNEARPRG